MDYIRWINELGERVITGGEANEEEALKILETDASQIYDLIGWANRIRQKFKGNKVHLCAIVNAKSGGCPEDCTFCSQSSRYNTGISKHGFLEREEVLREARDAKRSGAQALGLVAAWKGINEGPLLDKVCERIKEVAESNTVRADASLGIIEERQVAQRLKDAGLHVYNHNLESAKSHFNKICTTHSYEERIQTIKHVQSVGLKTCCGGIFGTGETLKQRVELALEIRKLDIDVVPLNFLHRIPETPLQDQEPLEPLEILKTICMFRFALPKKEIMIAGGRQVNLRDIQSMVFSAGASALMVGNYLTTQGRSARQDLQMLQDLGLDPQWSGWDQNGDSDKTSQSIPEPMTV